MTDQEPAKSAEASQPETPAQFLEGLAAKLKMEDGVDGDLAEILSSHILVPAPAKDAVARAKAAIDKLAAARAIPPADKPSNG